MSTKSGQGHSLFTGGKRDLVERHQTLRATLEWSLDLLRPEERVFFRRLGVLAGSFWEDAAAAVVADAGLDTLDGLSSPVEKSLLVRTELRGEARFHLLETVRELARECVAGAGGERAARLRHAEWILHFLAGEHGNPMRAEMRQAAHERLASEEVGARLALRFAAGAEGDPELAGRLFIHFGFARLSNAHTAEVPATHELLKPIPRSADPRRAALALGIWSWARAAMLVPVAALNLETACTVLEDAGDEVGARAILEESLYFCSGVGCVGIDSLCGALALLLAKSGAQVRALHLFGAVTAGAENETGYRATLTDPSGALRTATREARVLLGDPPPGDPAMVDLAAVLQAALGTRR